MSELEQRATLEPRWLVRLRKTGPYALAVFISVLLTEMGNLADIMGKSYDRFKTPEAFVLAENTAKSTFSDQLAQRAWRRLFWADNFRARVINHAPSADIDVSWKAYIDSDADWNANIMISIVGLQRYYGANRSAQLEGNIQGLFQELDDALAALRQSDMLKQLRAAERPNATQEADATNLAQRIKSISDALKSDLYILVRCFDPDHRSTNLCS